MNEIDALQNQFHDELHTTNLNIINVSNDLDELSNRFSSVEESNREVNNNLNEIAKSIDDISSRLKELDQKSEQSVEIQLRATKSAAPTIDLSELNDIHDEIHEVALAVDNLDSSLSPRVNRLEVAAAELYDHVDTLYAQDASIVQDMIDMDIEHHEELHRLALAIDNHESRIGGLERVVYSYDDRIIDLEREVHDVSTNMAILTEKVNEIPPHVVLTKDAYDDLDNPDYDTFYFTYEDED